MKLWRITTPSSDPAITYDCNRGHVIAAATPRAVRRLAAAEAMDEGPQVWEDARRSTVTLLAPDVAGTVSRFRPSILLTDSTGS